MNSAMKKAMNLALALTIAWPLTSRCNEITYIYTDMQLAPILEADASGNVLGRFDYTPFGMETTGTASEGIGYAGHMVDRDTNLVYMQARYYDPGVGRFLSIDPAGSVEGGVFATNQYIYANQNPYLYRDPDGRVVQLLVGAALSAGIDLAFQSFSARNERINWRSVAISAGAGFVSGGAGSLIKLRALQQAWSVERYAATVGIVNAGVGAAQSVTTDEINAQRPDLTKAAGTAILAGAVGASLARAANGPAISAQQMERQGVSSAQGVGSHVLEVTVTSGRNPHGISQSPVVIEKSFEASMSTFQEIDRQMQDP